MKKFWYWITSVVIKHLIKHFDKNKDGEITIKCEFGVDNKITKFEVE